MTVQDDDRQGRKLLTVSFERYKGDTLIEIAKSFISVLETAIWPFAILICISWFKNEIKENLPSLFSRVRKVGVTGAEFDAATAQQKSKDVTSTVEGQELEKLPAPDTSSAIGKVEAALKADLETIPEAEKKQRLVSAMARLMLNIGHEKHYRLIFGTQIAALKALNSSAGASIEEARKFFEENVLKSNYADFYKDYGFEGWSGFLIQTNLVEFSNNMFKITEFGRDFLIYMTVQGLPENKPW